MTRRHGGRLVAGTLVLALLVASGCASIGPHKMVQDRHDYNTSLTESWKRQILLNIVKVRYVEPMFFMDVGDIVAGYTLETGGNIGYTRTLFDVEPSPETVFSHSSVLNLGASGRYTDRPTITYRPMTGAPFRKGIMNSMPLRNVALGLDAGISARFLVSLGVRSINGLRNMAIAVQGRQAVEEGFARAVDILAQLQVKNALHVRSERDKAGGERLFLWLGCMRPTYEVQDLIAELQRLLDLDPELKEYALVEDPEPGARDRIVLQTYSLMQIMAHIANQVDVPEKDIASQLAMPRLSRCAEGGVLQAVGVRSSWLKPKPGDAFTAVRFHNHWFWVDNHDLTTKRVFSFLMLAFTLMESGEASTPL
ncbi:MAG: hypothetical protein ACOCWR_10880, partial [Oceanidesulfovibrio sp.]